MAGNLASFSHLLEVRGCGTRGVEGVVDYSSQLAYLSIPVHADFGMSVDVGIKKERERRTL
jgi:hypothetical protein